MPTISIVADAIGSIEAAKLLLARLESAGIVCVPIVPTDAMIDAAYYSALAGSEREVWDEMIKNKP